MKAAVITDFPLIARGIIASLSSPGAKIQFECLAKSGPAARFKQLSGGDEDCYLIFHYNQREDDVHLQRVMKAAKPRGLLLLHSDVFPENIEAIASDTVIALVRHDCEEEKLCKAFSSLLQGKSYLSESSSAKYIEKKARRKNAFGLSSRELEVLSLMASGMTVSAISFSLGISGYTVRNHVQRIYSKLGVNDRVNAVLKAIRYGLIDTEAGFSDREGRGSG